MSVASALAEWRRARASLGAAGSCRRDGYHADAVSRAYYAVLHAARAALESSGADVPRTHEGVSNRFGLHFVVTGLIERHIAAEIGRLHSLRGRADYDVGALFDEASAQDAISRAEAFLNRIRELLATSIPDDQLQL